MTANGEEGRLPEGWIWASPDELASEEQNALAIGPFGSNLKVQDYRAEGVPLVFVRNIRSGAYSGMDDKYVSLEKAEELRAHRVEAGDVLITKMGDPPGDAALYPQGSPPAIITADCIKWRVNAAVLPAFVVYMTNSPQMAGQIARITSGVAQQKVSLKRFKGLRYPVPPLAEQRRIVEKIEELFSDLDAGVQALEAVRRRLDRYRQSVLKAAVEGDLTRAWREQHGADAEPASVLLGRILEERRARWEADQLAKYEGKGKKPPKGWQDRYQSPEAPEADGLPELPEGWAWANTEQVAEVIGGLTKNAKRQKLPLQLPYLRVANVYADKLRLDEVEKIGVKESEIHRASLEKGDLLVVEGNGSIDQIGRVARWDGSIAPCLHQNHLIKVRPCIREMGGYALLWMLSPSGREHIVRVASSTSGLHTLSLSKVSAIPIPLPPLAEQEAIVEAVEERLSVVDAVAAEVDAQLARAGRLRRAILQHAFQGRLVPQDPDDEPASALLSRLRKAREQAPATSKRRASAPRQGELAFRVIDAPPEL